MKYLSLFSGIGGFELGIQQAYEDNIKCKHFSEKSKQKERPQGGVWPTNKPNKMLRDTDRKAPLCIGYSEIDKYAIQVYEKHFNHKNYGDATKIITTELPEFDLLVGGFPCQAFSIAGKRRGFDEARGTLFFDIARILQDKKPRNFILENVKGLLSHDGGNTFTTIIRVLADLGYFVEWQVLNAKNFGVPQNRERVFIVGHFGGKPSRKVFPIQRSDKIYNGENAQGNEVAYCLQAGSDKHRGSYIIHNIYGGFGESKNREFHKTAPTIRTPQGGGHIPNVVSDSKIRRLTPKECERLMGYPDDWTLEGVQGKISDTQRYKMCGNGIVSNVVKEVVKNLF